MDNRFTAVARVGRLFGDISSGGVSLSLYTTLPEDFDPTTDALFVEIDSLPVPLYCDKFERRGVSGANVCFADFDTQRRAEELVGKELYMELADEEGDEDEFYMEDLIGFKVEVGKLRGEITDYYDSEANPLFEILLDNKSHLIPAQEEFIANIDFEKQRIKFVLPDGLLEL
jgi:16S rRNA processing protein RimM